MIWGLLHVAEGGSRAASGLPRVFDDSNWLTGLKGILRKPYSGLVILRLILINLTYASCCRLHVWRYGLKNICTQWWCRRVNIIAPSSFRLLASHITNMACAKFR
jgi:hypothetical protein